MSDVGITTLQTNACDKTCGGQTEKDCTDFVQNTVSTNNCKTCVYGYVGGDIKGKACVKGLCVQACGSCQDIQSDKTCYICNSGFYDPSNDRTVATPCLSCDKSCRTCKGPAPNQCLVCEIGYFDSLNNPYNEGTCALCDISCWTCEIEAKNCSGGCIFGFKKINNGYKSVCVPGSGVYLSNGFIFLVGLIGILLL